MRWCGRGHGGSGGGWRGGGEVWSGVQRGRSTAHVCCCCCCCWLSVLAVIAVPRRLGRITSRRVLGAIRQCHFAVAVASGPRLWSSPSVGSSQSTRSASSVCGVAAAAVGGPPISPVFVVLCQCVRDLALRGLRSYAPRISARRGASRGQRLCSVRSLGCCRSSGRWYEEM